MSSYLRNVPVHWMRVPVVMTPSVRPAMAVQGLNVEPGDYWPSSARLNSGSFSASLTAS